MEAKLLMIGDWVENTEFGNGQGKYGRVEIIEATRVWLDNGKCYTPISSLRPIELTEEIMKKNAVSCVTWVKTGSGVVMEIDGLLSHWRGLAPYVHNLQHAYRLNGIEKEVEL